MKIEINYPEAQTLLERLAVPPECGIAKELYDRITLAVEMQAPEDNCPVPPGMKKRAGVEFGCGKADCAHCYEFSTANLQFSTLGVAQNIVKRVADQMCRADFDKNDAYLDLQRVVGMLETCMEVRS